MATIMESYTVDDDNDGNSFGDAFSAIAQGFTIGNTGANINFEIANVQVKIQKAGAPGNITASIFPAHPDGMPDESAAALSTGTFLTASGTTVARWETITMSAANLKSSTQYALVLEATGSAGNVWEWRKDITGPAYGGGAEWQKTAATSVWAAQAADTMFAILSSDFDATLCTLGDVVNKAGANASTSSTTEALITTYVKQAEGVINAITRFNWVDAYSGLTDDVKFLLNQVASDLAAIYAINYDMSAYTTETAEAETMLNVYRESIARGLSLLRNQKVKTFMVGDT